MFKLPYNCIISHASKVMLKIVQARLQQYMNWELLVHKLGLVKAEESEIALLTNIHWIIEIAKEFQKNIYFYSIDYAESFVWIIANCGKFLKRQEYQTTLSVSWETCMWVKKQQLEMVMEQLTGSILGKEYVKTVCVFVF